MQLRGYEVALDRENAGRAVWLLAFAGVLYYMGQAVAAVTGQTVASPHPLSIFAYILLGVVVLGYGAIGLVTVSYIGWRIVSFLFDIEEVDE